MQMVNNEHQLAALFSRLTQASYFNALACQKLLF